MFKVKYYVLLVMIMFFAPVQSRATGEDLIGELPNLAITAETEQARLRGIRLRLTRADEAILDRLHAQEENLILQAIAARGEEEAQAQLLDTVGVVHAQYMQIVNRIRGRRHQNAQQIQQEFQARIRRRVPQQNQECLQLQNIVIPPSR
jgi:DNA-binding MarR family transcriptional regulator